MLRIKLYRACKKTKYKQGHFCTVNTRERLHTNLCCAIYFLKSKCGFIPILVSEIVVHAKVGLSAKLITGLAVWDALDHSTLFTSKGKVLGLV